MNGTAFLEDWMRSARISTGRLAGLQELRNQEVGTGLSLSKGESMTEEAPGAGLQQRGENFNPDWIPFGVSIYG
jgi:hypothetical protein